MGEKIRFGNTKLLLWGTKMHFDNTTLLTLALLFYYRYTPFSSNLDMSISPIFSAFWSFKTSLKILGIND